MAKCVLCHQGSNPMRWNSVKKTAQWAVFRNSPEGFSLRGLSREARTGIPSRLPSNIAGQANVWHVLVESPF